MNLGEGPKKEIANRFEAMAEACTMLIEKDPFTGHSFSMNLLNRTND